MNNKLKSIIRITIFLLLLVVSLILINKIYKPKYGDGIYSMSKFYEQPEKSIDVIFFGSSMAFEDINTATLWDEQGIASYVLGAGYQPIWSTYYFVKEALKTQKPRLIVLEAKMVLYEPDGNTYEDRVMKSTYGMRWSQNKIDAIKTAITYEDEFLDYAIEYMQYHNRYTDLSESDYVYNQGNPLYDDWKGFACNTSVTPYDVTDVSSVTDRLPLPEKSEEYYRLIIELAKDNNIPILIIVNPYAEISEEDQARLNTANDIADEYDVSFLNLNTCYDEFDLDFHTDSADSTHLNYIGSAKLSSYLATYIVQKYDIPDRRGEAGYESWDRMTEYVHRQYLNQYTHNEYVLNSLIDYINGSGYGAIISIDGNYCLSEDEIKFLNLFDCKNITSNKIMSYIEGQGTIDELTDGNRIYCQIGNNDIYMSSSYYPTEDVYRYNVTINNISYRRHTENGINVVLYDFITDEIIDSFGIENNGEQDIIIR